MKVHCGLERLSVEVSCSCFSGCLVSRGSRGLVTWLAREGGCHLDRQPCNLPTWPSAQTAPDQAPPVARQHISMYPTLARRLLSSALSSSSSCSSTASLSTFLGGKEVLLAANHRRFSSTGSVRESFISCFSPWNLIRPPETTLPLLQSCNHAWSGAQAWGCCPKLLFR